MNIFPCNKKWFSWLLGVGVGMALFSLSTPPARAQPATTVQLPTFSHFGVATSVLVPDRGSASLGGVGRSAAQQAQWGWPVPGLGERSVGASSSSHLAGVSVWIHDFEAMEAQLLGQREPIVSLSGPGGWGGGRGKEEKGPATVWGASSAEQPVLSVAELRRQRQAEMDSQAKEAAYWFERGETAQTEGKLGAARVYYQMALRRAAGAMKQKIHERIESLSASAPTAEAAPRSNPQR